MPPFLLKLLRLQDATPAERKATSWIAAMFFCALAGTFVLRPLRSEFGVHRGVEQLPYLYSLTLLATVVCVLPFWWLANRTPSRRFIPVVQHVCIGVFLLLAIGLAAVGDYDWEQVPWFGELFWSGFSAINVVVPTLVWIHTVERFRREQAQRLFALIAVGGTCGAVSGSWFAGLLSEHAPLWASAVVGAGVLELGYLCFRASLPHCRRLDGHGAAQPRVASGGVFAGVRVLLTHGYVRTIGFYMLMLGMLAASFYAAQTELVGEQIAAGKQQHVWLADVEMYSQALVLTLQLFCTGRLMSRLPAVILLISLPVVSILGLGVWWLVPSASAIFFVQIFRRGTQYAFEKPAREVLYTPLDLETKHKAKFLLDTFAFRLGDLLGATLQCELRSFEIGLGGIVVVTIGVAVVWIALGFVLGRRPRNGTPAPA